MIKNGAISFPEGIRRAEDQVFRELCYFNAESILFIDAYMFSYVENPYSEMHSDYFSRLLRDGGQWDLVEARKTFNKKIHEWARNDPQLEEYCNNTYYGYMIETVKGMARNSLQYRIINRAIEKQSFYDDWKRIPEDHLAKKTKNSITAFKKTPLLFCGYTWAEWHLRCILKSIMGQHK